MAFLHRFLLLELPDPPSCPPHSSCNCTCITPPVAAGNSPPHHLLLPTSMTVMACTLGAFFFLCIVCTLARLYYLKRIESRRPSQPVLFDDFPDEERGPAVHHPIWLINFVGLQQSVIDSITVCKYKRGEGLIEDTECTVCLTEFEEDEDVRLLPKCSHAFHLPCIDTWLRSHKNCPLCRAPVAGNSPEMQQEPEQETRIEGSGTEIELDHHSQVDEDGSGAETDLGFGCRALSDLADNRRLVGVKPMTMRRSASMDSNSAPMSSLAVAKRNGNWDAKLKRQTSGACRGSSSLYKLMRSASSGRVSSMMRSYTSASSRNCRSQDSILPLST